MQISGDFSSISASLLLLRLEKCRESEAFKCKSDVEITEFFRDKWLILLYNERLFDSNNYGEDSIVFQSNFKWLNVNTQVQ